MTLGKREEIGIFMIKKESHKNQHDRIFQVEIMSFMRLLRYVGGWVNTRF